MTFSGTRISAAYFLTQAILITLWWVVLAVFPGARPMFVPPGAGEAELLAFALPDLALVVPGSLLSAVAILVRARWACSAAWLTTGAMGYALFYCISWAALRGGAWVSVLLMAPPTLLSAVCAVDVSASISNIFRRASPGSATRHVLVTIVQIIFFWSFFLFVVPSLLMVLERGLGGIAFGTPGQAASGWVLLAGFSALGLWSGMAIATRGQGTPLPFDATNRLVADGPYGYVRNPMVIAGLGQGASVGLLLGSWIVLAYVALGASIWQWVVRPAEERDLLATFGTDYAHYSANVPCWLPRRTRYRAASASAARAVRASD